jgi:putative SOS response-associated peptidase YedK
MPVLLTGAQLEAWLAPEPREPEELYPLLTACPPEWLCAFEVSKLVNNVRNDVPECIVPLRPFTGAPRQLSLV